MTRAHLEQAKYSASFLNSIAIAVATGGVLTPSFTALTAPLPATASPEVVIGTILFCVALGLIIHLIGRKILAEL